MNPVPTCVVLPAAGHRVVRLPWAPGEPPRFVCDTMTEGLARQLRMFGVDAASVPGGQTAKRHAVYR